MQTKISSKTIILTVLGFSVFASGLVFFLVYGFRGINANQAPQAFLPLIIALCNTVSALFLVMGLIRIKKKDVEHHKKFLLIALVSSTLFLVLYLARHTLYGDQFFLGQGPIRIFYFTLLITHIIGSVIALPLVLTTAAFAFLKRWPEHKSWANRTWALWLAVSLSGVLVFLLLQIYNK